MITYLIAVIISIAEVVLMVDMVHLFGGYAGKVWKLLDSEGPQTENQLFEKTGLESNEFYSAIGWLAKENKISIDDTTYVLGETNLTSKIGKDAGMVWKILDMWGEVDVESISRLASIEEKDAFSAIGWLAREGKIEKITVGKEKSRILFRLKY